MTREEAARELAAAMVPMQSWAQPGVVPPEIAARKRIEALLLALTAPSPAPDEYILAGVALAEAYVESRDINNALTRFRAARAKRGEGK
jgi:hypothetical protein